MILNQSSLDYSYTLPDGTVESSSKYSNEVSTDNLTTSFTKVKSSDKTYLLEGETAVQTVVLTNNSLTTIITPFFSDTLSSGASYVASSVIVGGVSQPTYDPAVGFSLASIAPGGSITIQYSIIADDPLTTTPVTNFATIDYDINDPIKGLTSYSENSNTIELTVDSLRITVVKSVDRAYATSGDTLVYTTVITNIGTITRTNLVFTDPIPTGTTFVVGSVLVGGVSQPTYDPAVGFVLPDLIAGASVTVVFSVLVV